MCSRKKKKLQLVQLRIVGTENNFAETITKTFYHNNLYATDVITEDKKKTYKHNSTLYR